MRPGAAPRTPGPLARVVAGLAALALGLLAVFLFTVFAVVAAALALFGLGRLWWLQRRGATNRGGRTLEAEYRVSEGGETARTPDAILPPSGREP